MSYKKKLLKNKICQICKKSTNKKYCSKKCKNIAARLRQRENEQMCWRCKKATGACSWSKELKPVDGWVAEPIMLKDDEGIIRTYNIILCPEYEEE